jgi:hypothetical protein
LQSLSRNQLEDLCRDLSHNSAPFLHRAAPGTTGRLPAIGQIMR